MKYRLILSILFVAYISTSFAQSFRFVYSEYGLGSNRGQASDLIIIISDTTLTYKVFEKIGLYTVSESTFGDTKYIDTSWTKKQVAHDVPFRKKSQDSLIQLVKGMEGQYIFRSNPNIMSGGIQYLSFEYSTGCTAFSLKNTFDSIAMNAVNIINPYLPVNYKIYVPEEWWKDRSDPPLIKTCPVDPNRKYSDVLGDEYDLIRQNSKKKQK